MKDPKEPTIRDVAKAAGVTPSTVSRAFNGGTVRETTRLRILAAASQLGYVANDAARQLRAGTATGIGVIVRDLANYYTSYMLTSLVTRIQRSGRQMLLGNFDNAYPDNARIMRKFIQAAAGVVLVSPGSDVMELASECDPRTTVLANYQMAGYASVTPDESTGMERALRHLVALGHRRIVYVRGPSHAQTGDAKHRTFVETCAELGLEPRAIGPFPATYRNGFSAADLLLTIPDATAAIVYNDILAAGVLMRFNERGMSIPRDFSVVGIDDSPVANLAYPQLTSINNRQGDVGDTAAKLLLDQLARLDGSARHDRRRTHDDDRDAVLAQTQPFAEQRIRLTETLTIRQSTGPARRT